MPVLGITGGIGTGKSTFVTSLRQHIEAQFFDADATAHTLLGTDPQVHAAVRASFGEAAFSPEGIPDRVRLREIIFQAPAQRAVLEAILHPAIRQQWMNQAAAYRLPAHPSGAGSELRSPSPSHQGEPALTEADTFSQTSSWLFVDIPLLYETEAERHVDRVVVVACSPETQRARLRAHRRLDDPMIEKIIGAQHDLRQKITRADHVIWNDSTVSCLDGQAKLLAGWLRNYHV